MRIVLRPGTYIDLILDKLQYKKYISFTEFNLAAARNNITDDLTYLLSRLL